MLCMSTSSLCHEHVSTLERKPSFTAILDRQPPRAPASHQTASCSRNYLLNNFDINVHQYLQYLEKKPISDFAILKALVHLILGFHL